LSKHPESQCARAIAKGPNGHVAVCANDGSVTIRDSAAGLGDIVKELTDSKEWIECAEYSPSGKYLAVGSHDTNIYIYDTENDYALLGKCTKHSATITCIDWS
jgi:WD40 repeat protein